MVEFSEWNYQNKHILRYLYAKLLILSNKHKIQIINSENTYNNFLKMMYHSSSKKILSRELFPEYYDIYYHANGSEEYKTFDL
jgi:hypothetical protein